MIQPFYSNPIGPGDSPLLSIEQLNGNQVRGHEVLHTNDPTSTLPRSKEMYMSPRFDDPGERTSDKWKDYTGMLAYLVKALKAAGRGEDMVGSIRDTTVNTRLDIAYQTARRAVNMCADVKEDNEDLNVASQKIVQKIEELQKSNKSGRPLGLTAESEKVQKAVEIINSSTSFGAKELQEVQKLLWAEE